MKYRSTVVRMRTSQIHTHKAHVCVAWPSALDATEKSLDHKDDNLISRFSHCAIEGSVSPGMYLQPQTETSELITPKSLLL